MTTYAANTSVSVESSQAEIERILTRYGADKFMYGWESDRAAIAFRAKGKHVRFELKLPLADDKRFTTYKRGSVLYLRAETESRKLWEQACRQKWRALTLVIKAKLEAVEAEISTFEDEFLANILLPDGRSVGDWMRPQVEQMYLDGQMPPLLLEAGHA